MSVPADIPVVATSELVTGPPGVEMLRRYLPQKSEHSESLQIMDNACGGGIITSEVLKLVDERSLNVDRIVASDKDDEMVACVGRRAAASNWQNFEAMKIDQQSVPLPDHSFSHVFNNFGIFFSPDDTAALMETHRILKDDGTAGFTSWKKISWWPTLAVPAISKFIPDAPELPNPTKALPTVGWNDPAATPTKLEKAGFKDIQVSEYSFQPNVAAEEFAQACAFLVRSITKRFWSKSEDEQYGPLMEPALLRYLKENYRNGVWDGEMVAIITTGRK